MSEIYKVAETESFSDMIRKKEYSSLYAKITEYVYPLLKSNPFFGPKIKKLKGEFEDYFRFRIGDYRLFYIIDEKEKIVFIVSLKHRKDAYKRK